MPDGVVGDVPFSADFFFGQNAVREATEIEY
jgi:hypothetical protein